MRNLLNIINKTSIYNFISTLFSTSFEVHTHLLTWIVKDMYLLKDIVEYIMQLCFQSSAVVLEILNMKNSKYSLIRQLCDLSFKSSIHC